MSLNSRQKLIEISKVVCRDLRKRSTNAERILWNNLRNKKLSGKKFYRQHPIFHDITGKEIFFVADFYCHQSKLIIELDGEYHKYRLTEDRERTNILNNLGLNVIRFTNKEVEENLKKVLKQIKEEVK